MILDVVAGFLFFTVMVAALAIACFLWGLVIFALWSWL